MNDNSGWIKLHRKMLDNPVVMKDTDHVAVWIYLLLNASHAEYPVMFKGKKIFLQPGQLITGRKVIASALYIDESKVTRILELLKNEHQIEQQTSNRNRLISIVNWGSYQQTEQQNELQVNNKRTTDEQQVNTNKNVKEYKEGKEVVDLYHSTCVSYPLVKSLSDARKKAINARLKKYSLDDFKVMFEKAEASDFLKGANDRNWSANFDWLLKDSNMAKVLDGNYDNKPEKKKKETVPNGSKNQFNVGINTHDYDFDELEKLLVNRHINERNQSI